ncbi:HvfC family RiPP maturation protein [Methylomonas rivi]|uniref:DNA-binding domain-containing protein n=1 Tax=Methylomonas rivi TaxID=2952226 RepID=A0ABT1U7U3_9GAMM|nr:putative DNA-binding domain-containing protein [Methylomonas sp. WSC-6]MCQ8129852.1 putative DNA-binding domain-containing protein [Methylomonas sp. WSC-6]
MTGFHIQQRHFLAYLRQPQTASVPAGFAPERLAVYAGLLYNKFDESLSACFPVIQSILSRTEWRALLLDFIAEHRCLSPYYRRIPDEFVQYLLQERRRDIDKPFLAELAHFEWIELQLAIDEAAAAPIKTLTDPQLLANVPLFAPVMQLLHYHWPVQDIGPTFQPKTPPANPTHILGFRDSNDLVRFIALNPATARLARLLCNGYTGRQALESLGSGLDEAGFVQLMQFGLQTLAELHRRGAIIDTRPADLSGVHP